MKLSDIDNNLNLHLKDYDAVREDVDQISGWLVWGVKIVLGAVILALLAIIGLK